MMMIESEVWNRNITFGSTNYKPTNYKPINQTRDILSPTPEFVDNLTNHGMLGINPWSSKPLVGVNSKPE